MDGNESSNPWQDRTVHLLEGKGTPYPTSLAEAPIASSSPRYRHVVAFDHLVPQGCASRRAGLELRISPAGPGEPGGPASNLAGDIQSFKEHMVQLKGVRRSWLLPFTCRKHAVFGLWVYLETGKSQIITFLII